MPKIICVKDEVEYRIFKTGGWVVEHASFGPYKIWSFDGWECPICNHRIMAGHGDGPISEHYQDDFKDIHERLLDEAELVVNSYELNKMWKK